MKIPTGSDVSGEEATPPLRNTGDVRPKLTFDALNPPRNKTRLKPKPAEPSQLDPEPRKMILFQTFSGTCEIYRVVMHNL